MRLVGALLAALACLDVALLWSRSRRERINVLDGLIRAMNVIEAELGGKASPLPPLMTKLSREDGTIGAFFAAVSDALDSLGAQPFSEIWRSAVHAHFSLLPEWERSALTELGNALGRYPLQMQREAVALCREQLREQLALARKQYGEQARLVWALALSAGVLLGIVLI